MILYLLFQIHGTFGRHNESSIVRTIPDFPVRDVFGRSLHYHGIYWTYKYL